MKNSQKYQIPPENVNKSGHVQTENIQLIQNGYIPSENGHIPPENVHIPHENGHIPHENGHIPHETTYLPQENGNVSEEKLHLTAEIKDTLLIPKVSCNLIPYSTIFEIHETQILVCVFLSVSLLLTKRKTINTKNLTPPPPPHTQTFRI